MLCGRKLRLPINEFLTINFFVVSFRLTRTKKVGGEYLEVDTHNYM